VTGILDRLEKDGWILRERDTEDRRKVLIKARLERTPELGRLFAPMLGRMSEILKGYSDDQLEVVVGFLKQVRDAGDGAVGELRERARAR
jgi:DNA-binding MarR family transcriptional regulator